MISFINCFGILDDAAVQNQRKVKEFRIHPKFMVDVKADIVALATTGISAGYTTNVLTLLGRPVIIDHNVDGIEAILE